MLHGVSISPGMTEGDPAPQGVVQRVKRGSFPGYAVWGLRQRGVRSQGSALRNGASRGGKAPSLLFLKLPGLFDLYNSGGRKHWKVKVIEDETLNIYQNRLIFLCFKMLLHSILCEIRWIREK